MTGSGKTTVTLGLLSILRNQGIGVQPFKVGPDFIDPGLHEAASGVLSHNLDGWMISRETNEWLFAKACRGKDVAIIEGVMGLFDSSSGRSSSGSTAEIADWLGVPVVLVIDAYKLGRSVGAIVHGYRTFDPHLTFAGIILNRVAGEGHFRILADALSDVPILAWLPANPSIEIPERHLGLLTAREDLVTQRIATIADFLSAHIDVGRLVKLLPDVTVAPAERDVSVTVTRRKRVALAYDKAFSFYYHANRHELERAGAEIVEFSPLTDYEVPGADLLYIGGGYPELYREQLESNLSMRTSIRRFIDSGGRFYAECGGLMYLSQSIEGSRMVGVLPTEIQMTGMPVDFGYCEVTTCQPSILGPAGTIARGHQFHYSKISGKPTTTLYTVKRGDRRQVEGFVLPNGVASYIHLHFLSNRSLAESLLSE
jgi:cobyrinic acid a,c-diamide synthase